MLENNPREYSEAVAFAEGAYALIAKFQKEPFGSPEALALDTRIRALVRPGFYVHFKTSAESPKYYEVHDIERQVNYQLASHLYQVSYTAQYPPMNGRKGLRELLGENGFLTPVRKGGYIGPRFKWVGEKCPA